MRNMRRLSTAVVAAGALTAAVFFLAPDAQGQRVRLGPKVIIQTPPTPPMPPVGDTNPATQFSAIKLIEKDEFQQYINLAQDYLAGKQYDKAVKALQRILDNKEDYYAQVKRTDSRTGAEKVRWASVKFEANNLLGSMPADGLDAYELAVGASARDMLAEAKRKGDRELLAEVAQRYMHTRAGAEANDLLATTFLDRGQFFTAALRFERLLALKESRYKLGDLTLFKAALAYRRAGDVANADRIWKRLAPRLASAGGLRVGDDTIATARLKQVLDQIPRPPDSNPHDWIMVNGNLTRSAQAKGSPPLLDEVLWSRKTLQDKNDESGEVDRGQEARAWLDQALTRSRELALPIMPGFFPIAAGGKLIYRTYKDITAVNLQVVLENGKVVVKPGDIEWKSTDLDGSPVATLADPKTRGTLDTWLREVYNRSGFLNLFYENSTIGVLSTDHRLVYAVDDLAIPAPPTYLAPHVWNSQQVSDAAKTLVMANSLQAFELDTGKIAFRLGDPAKNDEFSNSHFLGVPVSIGGKIYVLNEKNDGQLRLFCIDPRLEPGPDGKLKWNPVVVPPVQVLGTVAEHHRVTHDIARRATAVHLAYGEGILVCPTNAGEVLGVDLMSRTLAWAYPYRQSPPNPQSMVSSNPQFQFQPPNRVMALSYANWKVSPPVIADGKVVFTAPDSLSVHCINLRDGSPVWAPIRQQDNDLFLAGVIDGKILIVGKNSCRAYRLADGESLWTLATGDVPSGQGVASKNSYYLPLRKGEIAAIDMNRGTIAHNRSAKPGAAPGNLVFYEGAVLSQTVDEVVAYPQLSAKLHLADVAVKADPNNLDKLTSRGELLLRDGQVQSAVEDLRAVYQKDPQGALRDRVRQQLYDAFTDLMQADFKNASGKYLDEYRALCKVPGDDEASRKEQEGRQAKFLRILGQGRESEGDLVAAFQAYREFGSLPLFHGNGVPLVEDPSQTVPTPVWLRGRVMTMLSKATAEQKRPLEAKIGEEWKAVEGRGDLEAIRSFVGMFDVPFQVGREARLRLADTIIKNRDVNSYLEAELNLQQLRVPGLRDDPQVGGLALDALARLEISRGKPESMKQAVAYYKELSREFPKTVLRDRKTGAELFHALFNDKRFLEHMTEAAALWGKAEIKAREVPPGNIAPGLQGFLFQPQGDVSPFMRQHRLVLDPVNSSSPLLRVLDMATNKVRGDPINLGNIATNYMFFRHLYDQAERNLAYHANARFRFYQGKGHLAVFQVGTMVYGLDLASVKLLWQHTLLDVNQAQPQVGLQVMPDPEGNLWLTITDQFGRQTTKTRVGHVGAVQASYVALTTQKGLVVLDPLRGTTLWSKPAVPPQTEVFGDDQHIYLVNTSSAGITGPTQVLRASDGSPVEAPQFTYLYTHHLRTLGRNLLVADPANGKMTLRLHDVLAGKDLWKQSFEAKSTVLDTEDPNLAGAIEPNGALTVVDLRNFKEVLKANVIQFRVTQEDVANLRHPLLLADAERFYLALNTPVDQSKVAGGVLSNNFANGLRCAPVNGWFCAFDRKTGEFLWHIESRTNNQMIVLEQFQSLPVLLFSVRYTQAMQGGVGGTRLVSYSGSVNKATGKVIWWPVEARTGNGNAQFYAFNIDVAGGTINMIGYIGTVQHYVDDGRKRPEDNRNGALVPGAGPGPAGIGPPALKMPIAVPGLPPPKLRPNLRRLNGLPPQGNLRLEAPRGIQLPPPRDRLLPPGK